MAKRKKKTARRAVRRTEKTSARRAKSARKTQRRATRVTKKRAKSSNRKKRVMHCPAVIRPDGSVHPAQFDGKLEEGEKACGKTKTCGPRYNYYCEEHKGLSPAAQKAGLLKAAAENGHAPEPAAAPQVAESAEVAVTTPPVVEPPPEEKAEIEGELEAAKAAESDDGLNGAGPAANAEPALPTT